MAISVTFAGIDRTASSRFESLEVVNTVASNADLATLQVTVQPGSTWRPMAGNEVIVTNGATREFAGVLMEVTERGTFGPQLRYICSCRDYLHYFNKKAFVQEYTSPVSADTIVIDVVSGATDGFSSTGVIAAPTVPAQKFDYIPRGDVVRSLANTVNYAWWIDYNKVVNFVSSIAMIAPTTKIDLDSKSSSDLNNYGNMDITESVSELKNRVFVKGWKQKSTLSYTNSFVGDAASKFFMWGYEASAVGDVTATLNGVPLSVGTDQIDASPGDGIGSSSSIFICFDNLGARFGNYAPTSTETLVIAGTYMIPGILMVEDTVAQSTATSREGGDGIHEYVFNDPGLTASNGSDSLAAAKGNFFLTRDAYARISGKFTSYLQGWRAGQYFTLSSVNRMQGINKTVYVQEVRKKLVNHPAGGTPLLFYSIQFIDSLLAQ